MTGAPAAGGAINTPDQRLRVFVSSTLAELAPERAAVARAISSLRLTPVMFELGARPHPPQELYRAYLEQSDIFVGLYWERYGWVGPGMEISGLEDEFRLSVGLPRLLYLKTPSDERDPELSAMLAGIESQGADAYRRFSSLRELGRLVRDDLALLMSERFGTSGHHAAPTTRRSIPAASTSLIGRDDDIAAVSELLDQGDVRLVTLTGPGGIGKTRLAIAVGERFDTDSRLRPLFVPLASLTSTDLVLPTIASVAGVTIEGTRSPLDFLVEHFSVNPALLILDNLEQVAGVAPELDQLLSFCPDLKILATSRTVLRLRAEREYAVAALAEPDAVELFVDRARAVRHDFAVTDTNSAAVFEICRRLDGLPLALELAAARTRLLDPAALLARLGTVLDALGTGPVDLPERQRTLRATVEWSMDLLDDRQRRLLSTLSVFSDGWTVDAAASVAEQTPDQTLDLLDGLAGNSLVTIDAAEASPRFRMLTAVRELAAELLGDTAERARAEQRHAAHFAALVDGGDLPTGRQSEWAARLLTEEQNLRIAIRWFFDHDVAPLPHMFRTLGMFWQMSDRMPEGRGLLGELRLRPDPLDDHARAEMLFALAVTACAVGDDEIALDAMKGIRVLQPTLDDPTLDSELNLALSWTLPIVGDPDASVAAAQVALEGFRARSEPFAALAVLTLGMLELSRGQYDAARRYLDEANEWGDRFRNTWLTSTVRTQLASLAVSEDQLETARTLLDESIASFEGTDVNTLTASFALVAYAQLALAQGDARQAAIALGAVGGLQRRAGLLSWPLTRRGEAALAERLALRADAGVVEEGLAIGAGLNQKDALALLRPQPPGGV